MNGKVVLRVQKIKSPRALRGALAHNLRLQDTPNADPTKSRRNKHGQGMVTIDECMSRYKNLIGTKKVRTNAVHAIEVVVSGSPERMHEMTPKERNDFFKESLDWLGKEFGGKSNCVGVVVHNDEKTPHMHVIFTPIVDGKLNARAILGGTRHRMTQMQTDFAKNVSEKYGLERGVKGSKATHTTVKEYYKQTQELEAVKADLERVKADLLALHDERLKSNNAFHAERLKFDNALDAMRLKLDNAKEIADNAIRKECMPLIKGIEMLVRNMDPKELDAVHIELERLETRQIEITPGSIKDDIKRAMSPLRKR